MSIIVADMIRFLVLHNQLLEQFLQIVLVLLTLKPPKKKISPVSKSPSNQKFQLDPLQRLAQLEKNNHQELLQTYLAAHGKPLRPVKRRKKSTLPAGIACPSVGRLMTSSTTITVCVVNTSEKSARVVYPPRAKHSSRLPLPILWASSGQHKASKAVQYLEVCR